ncbi:MAG: DUF192 domain-containing protein [Pseudomonadota bacterium]
MKSALRAFVLTWLSVSAIALDLPERPIDFDRLRSEFDAVSVIVEGRVTCVLIDALIADTREKQRRGLMWVQSMPLDAGMIFDNSPARQVSMWMKNTLIPLDILFIDRGGRVINIERNNEPLSLSAIASDAPARYTLELNGGRAESLGLKRGSHVWVESL